MAGNKIYRLRSPAEGTQREYANPGEPLKWVLLRSTIVLGIEHTQRPGRPSIRSARGAPSWRLLTITPIAQVISIVKAYQASARIRDEA
jgi:hypothetical protein